jgi:hypothetical protein
MASRRPTARRKTNTKIRKKRTAKPTSRTTKAKKRTAGGRAVRRVSKAHAAKVIPLAGRRLTSALKKLDANAALKRVYEELRGQLAKAVHGDALARYRIGARVLEIEKTPKKYGTGAANTLADLLSLDRSTLSLYKSVAETWRQKDVEALLKKESPGRVPLTFYHLVELAGVTDANARDRFVELALREGLSVRALRNKINGTDAEGDEEEDSRDNLGPLRTAASHWQAEIKQVESRTDSILKHVKESFATPALRKWLATCAEHQRALAEKAGACADRIKKVHDEMTSASSRATRHS